MLSKSEINRLLSKEKVILADKDVQKEAEGWDRQEWSVSPAVIGLVYSYIKHRYKGGESLCDMERSLGVAMEVISFALRNLEAHGYVTISRARKPFEYRVVK